MLALKLCRLVYVWPKRRAIFGTISGNEVCFENIKSDVPYL